MLPVVMHHGIFGFGNLKAGPLEYSYFHGIDLGIAARGHRVVVSRVHPTAGIERRAEQLKAVIRRELPDEGKVILVAHSLGGLDARYMISRLGMADRVAALLTVATPHRGSPYADFWADHLGRRLGVLRLAALLGMDVRAISDLTTASCRRFNDLTPDAPGVRYYCVSGVRALRLVPRFAMHAHAIVSRVEGENDSLVSVQSSIWGNHLGIWPADHFHLINKRLAIESDPPTGDVTGYYLAALERIEADLMGNPVPAGIIVETECHG